MQRSEYPRWRWILTVLLFTAAVASVSTCIDWRKNPGGLFRSAEGTQWQIVGETWVSWFLPAFAIGSAAVIVILLAVRGCRSFLRTLEPRE